MLIVASLGIAVAVNVGLLLTMLATSPSRPPTSTGSSSRPSYDVVAVAAGYVLRTIAGATAAVVPISPWFFVVTSFGALLMVAGKREGESNELAGSTPAPIRTTLGIYTATYLTYLRVGRLRRGAGRLLPVGVRVRRRAPALVAISPPRVVSDVGGTLFKLSIIPFVIAILRYALLLDQGEGSEPEKLVFRDRPLQIAGVVVGHHLRLWRLPPLAPARRTPPQPATTARPPSSAAGATRPRRPPTCAAPTRRPT